MQITTDDQLKAYLSSKQWAFQSIERLSGGTANLVWRLKLPSSGPEAAAAAKDNSVSTRLTTRIIKHAEPFVANIPSMTFPVERMDFEASAISKIRECTPPLWCYFDGEQEMPEAEGKKAKTSILVSPPELFDHDTDNHVLVLEDGGPQTLKNAYAQLPAPVIRQVGRAIGRWLATLHFRTSKDKRTRGFAADNHNAKNIYRYPYQNLASTLQEYGVENGEQLGRDVNETFGSLIARDEGMIVHGDFWPGNILVSFPDDKSQDIKDAEREPTSIKLTVVDWELVRWGNGATDVGQFAAEAWLLDHFRGGKGLQQAFLKGYSDEQRRLSLLLQDQEEGKEESGLEMALSLSLDHTRAAAHMGTHLGFWPARVEWGNREETKRVIQFGAEILRQALAGDGGWMRERILGI